MMRTLPRHLGTFLAVAAIAAIATFGVLNLPALATATGEAIHGRVELLAKGGKGPARGSDVRQAVVYFEPAAKEAVKVPDGAFAMTSKDKDFVPHLLVVPLGARVAFPNEDKILHNVFSVSPGNAFDLGFYGMGKSKDKKLDAAGLVRVYCNVHHGMVGYILVLDTPFSTMPGADGSFTLTGLPKGPGKLTVWQEQADFWKTDLTLPSSAPVVARLEVVHPLVPTHLNKEGRAYFKPGDEY